MRRPPDYRLFGNTPGNLQQGLAIGVDQKLPRAPALYAAKLKRKPLSDSDGDEAPKDKNNYLSVKSNKQAVRQQFEMEEKLHAMTRVTESKGKSKYGNDLVIAAVGAIEKSD